MLRHLGFALLAGAALAAPAPADDKKPEGKIRVVLIDGQNNHDWRTTSPFMKKALEDSGRFTVSVSTAPLSKNDKRPVPSYADSVPFPPDLGKFDVVLSNYNGQPWPADFQKQLDERLKEGQIGLVIVHAANNAFGGWKEYNQMIGMGWRGPKGGARLKLDDSGKEIRVPAGEGEGSGHRYVGEFQVTLRDRDHPVTKGMPAEWMHARDELYDNMRGPIENVHLLATAYSKGTKAHEPMIWTVAYGKGRVFHTPMGHDVNAMRCVGFVTTLRRGTEWAATGKVTIPIPDNFPTAKKSSSVPK
ncbi:MAG TPA: ThuA domain-containing protein [Gemmataceae bacterium]|nr:ThuA domain-containing protein [Gemmataceae bacterium]